MSKTGPAVRLPVRPPLWKGFPMATAPQKIVPHLWYDKEAVEAAKFYCSILPDSHVDNVTTIHDPPSGDCDIVSFTLMGQQFQAISAGPLFKFNESISFQIHC